MELPDIERRHWPSGLMFRAPGLHHFRFADAQFLDGGLLAAVVQQRHLHCVIHRQRLASNSATRLLMVSWSASDRAHCASLPSLLLVVGPTAPNPPSGPKATRSGRMSLLSMASVPAIAADELRTKVKESIALSDGSSVYVFTYGKLALADKQGRAVTKKVGNALEAKDGRRLTLDTN